MLISTFPATQVGYFLKYSLHFCKPLTPLSLFLPCRLFFEATTMMLGCHFRLISSRLIFSITSIFMLTVFVFYVSPLQVDFFQKPRWWKQDDDAWWFTLFSEWTPSICALGIFLGAWKCHFSQHPNRVLTAVFLVVVFIQLGIHCFWPCQMQCSVFVPHR